MPASEPVFNVGGITLFEGDVVDLFDELPLDGITVLLTDPPYAAHRYLRETEESRAFNAEMDGKWMHNVSLWVCEWFWQTRMKLGADGVGWVFCNVHYLGFYLRWAKFARWPLRGIFALPPDEFLLAFGPESLTANEGRLVQDACANFNVYGQNKDLRMLDAILKVSPPGVVFDPFAGQGSTLVSARRMGRRAVGVEIQHETVVKALTTLERTRAARVQ
jgi:hypothetical protein